MLISVYVRACVRARVCVCVCHCPVFMHAEEQVQGLLQSDVVDSVIDKKLTELMARPEGSLLL